MAEANLWSNVPDDELLKASEHLGDYTEKGQQEILEELERRQAAAEDPGTDHGDSGYVFEAEEETSSVEAQLEKRYRDAYRVSRATTAIAGLIKAVGILAGLSGLVIAYLSAEQSSSLAFVAAAASVIIGLVVYGLGILIAAQGQQLMAAIDDVVGGSPFLSDRERASIMGLDVD